MDLTFSVFFTSDAACRLHFKSIRDEVGIVCKKCKSLEHYWQRTKWTYECKNCSFRTSLRSGTIMENSKLPFIDWYKTIFLLRATKKKVSAKKIQSQLFRNSYGPILKMVNILNSSINQLNDQYTIEKVIDENRDYFTAEISNWVNTNEELRNRIEFRFKDSKSMTPDSLGNYDFKNAYRIEDFLKFKICENHLFKNDLMDPYLDISQFVMMDLKTLDNASVNKSETKKHLFMSFKNIAGNRNLENFKLVNYVLIKSEVKKDEPKYLNMFCEKLNAQNFSKSIYYDLIFNHFFIEKTRKN